MEEGEEGTCGINENILVVVRGLDSKEWNGYDNTPKASGWGMMMII